MLFPNHRKYRIGELFDCLGFSRDVLLYYENKGIVIPHKNPMNNYREYSPDDINTILIAEFYKKKGLSVNEIRELKNSNDVSLPYSLVKEKRIELEAKLEELSKSIQQIKKTEEFFHSYEKNLNRFTVTSFPTMEIIEKLPMKPLRTIIDNQPLKSIDIFASTMRCIEFDEKKSDIVFTPHLYFVNFVDKKTKNKQYFSYNKCIYSVLEEGEYAKKDSAAIKSTIHSFLTFAKNNNFRVEQKLFGRNRYAAFQDNKHRIFVELFLPIL